MSYSEECPNCDYKKEIAEYCAAAREKLDDITRDYYKLATSVKQFDIIVQAMQILIDKRQGDKS